jgi:2-polyprenyl-3-methyl-5-hydroxy-6-metoxy-1,4-benzoquinol methylase
VISESYRELNRKLHESKPEYGTSGQLYGTYVAQLAASTGCKTLLDYGCGKGTLKQGLSGIEVQEYDPAVAGKDDLAAVKAADLVTCTDVLEHIEPEHLDAVLALLRHFTKRILFVAVHCGPAVKILADGRNAHLIQRPPRWWNDKLWSAAFDLNYFQVVPRGFIAVYEAK